MQSVLIITISGKDRSGLVERLAKTIAAHEGNWEHCRMAHLADRFVGLLQVSVPEERREALEAALRGVEDLEVTLTAGDVGSLRRNLSESDLPRQFDLEVVGSDHPGIVRDIFKALAAVGVNVEELSTSTESAPDYGSRLFRARARLACPAEVERGVVRERVEAIAHDIMVDVTLTD